MGIGISLLRSRSRFLGFTPLLCRSASSLVVERLVSNGSRIRVRSLPPKVSLFIYADYLNTPRLVADANDTTVWRWDQPGPFGSVPAGENLFDKETDLHYNYFRDYCAQSYTR